MSDDVGASQGWLPKAKHFPRHFYAFAGFAALTLIANLGFDAGLPLFWPIAAWSVAVAIHFFIASAADVSEDWIEDKTLDLKMRSYDFGHIDNIKDRVQTRDDSIVHHEEREKKDSG